MKNVVELGRLTLNGQLVSVHEEVPDDARIAQGKDFKVQLKAGASDLALELNEVRALRRLLAEAERRLVHRHDQATRARNMTLDL